jgi:hypothetical protein
MKRSSYLSVSRLKFNRLAPLFVLVLLSSVATAIVSASASNGQPTSIDPATAMPVVRIGNETVSAAEYQEKVREVQSNLTYMRGVAASGDPSAAYMRRFLDLINRYGPENVAFAGLIEDRAVYQLAVERGFAPSNDYLSIRIEADRKLITDETVTIPATTRAYIDEVGADYYWTVLFPDIERRQITTQAFWKSITLGATYVAEATAVWTPMQRQAVEQAPVEVLNPAAIAPATKEMAVDYLNAYWALPAP